MTPTAQSIPLQQHALPVANAPQRFKIIDTPQGALRLTYAVLEPASHWGQALFILCFGLWLISPCYLAGPLLCFGPLLLGLCFFSLRFLGKVSTRYEYELQPDRLVFRHYNLWGCQRSTSIPKVWIRSIRANLSPGAAENPDVWTLELVWADQKVLLLPDGTPHKTTAQWLGTVIATWAALGVVWQSSSGAEMLYQAGAAPAVVQPTRPRLTASDISEGWQTALFTLLLLGLFTLSYVEVTDSLFRVLGLSFTGLFLFGFLLKSLRIALVTPRFQQEGVETQGVITQRWIEYAPAPKEDQYWLAYQFPAGAETKAKVKPAVYAAHQVGDPVQVAYLSTDPHISFVEWEA
ncbi:MAG: hypothetical protein U0350_02035 [Caldilineaceae bacterium]